jgi:two-component system chemotaxis response regulator CheB
MSKKVLIVDDSALVRKQLSEIIEPLEFEIDTAKNGQEALDKVLKTQYDVITMDINMPVMDGIEAVKRIMHEKPTPILMISSLTTEDATITMDALDLGAVDYIAKPGTMNVGKKENSEDIMNKVKSLSKIPVRRLKRRAATRVPHERRQNLEAKKDAALRSSLELTKVVVIGSSTGGPGLIEQICAAVPSNYKFPICIVQHMPEQFTKAFAQRLDRASQLNVVETSQGMEIVPGNIYLARGGVHMHFAKKVSGKIVIREEKEKGNSYFQPSVNEMMNSAVDVFGGKNLIGVLLTGIGDDGADGMVNIRKNGGYTLGESEESATVYGMPKEAFERGGVMEQLDFMHILKKIATLK